jgi:AcrR family transcriptional regulator
MTVDNAEQIRSVATQLFARHGYEGVSLQAIAERVGVTKQTLLYHFSSKDVLRKAVLDQVFAHWRERLPQMLEAVTSGHGRFDALTRELFRFFEADADRARLMVRELLDNPEEMRRMLAENLRPWVLLVGQYIREGQRIGLIQADVDPESYVLTVISLVLSTVSATGVAEAVLGEGSNGARAARERHQTELLRLTKAALFKPKKEPATRAGKETT